MSDGSLEMVCEIADCTSWATASISRSSLNCRVMEVSPRILVELIISRPAIDENFFSSGVATEDAIVSGPAPGRFALTVIMGKSTFGRSFTGSLEKDIMPKIINPQVKSVVITGRLIKKVERFMVLTQGFAVTEVLDCVPAVPPVLLPVPLLAGTAGAFLSGS